MSSRCVIPLAPLLSCLSGLSSRILRRVPSFSAALSCPQMASCLPRASLSCTLSCTLSYTGARTHALVCLCGCVCSCGRERVYAHIECLAKKAKLARLRHEPANLPPEQVYVRVPTPYRIVYEEGGREDMPGGGFATGNFSYPPPLPVYETDKLGQEGGAWAPDTPDEFVNCQSPVVCRVLVCALARAYECGCVCVQ